VPRIALIINTGSGDGDAARTVEILKRYGAIVEIIPVERAAEAADCEADRVVVAGGDGSIGPAAAAAGQAGVPLAVLACGTANDFAGNAGLPADLEGACDLAVNGTGLRRLELAVAGARPFVNVVSAGLAPAAAEEAAGLKHRLGSLAYPVGAVGAGATQDPIGCSVSTDGEPIFTGKAWQISVASSGAFGGGSSLAADESDGRLDVVIIESGSRARLIRVAYGLTLGTVEDQPGVISERAEDVALGLDRDEQLNVDGELIAAGELADGDGLIHFGAILPGFQLVVG
jgi:diacylglycerol kinase (ATP)